MFSQFRNGLSLLRLVCCQLVPYRAVVMAVLQVIVQFRMCPAWPFWRSW
ncbi:hypothetical protein ECDEC11B_5363 [Escherichia coli DEC11B]|nr:hypothetical protein ECDEC11B_5363 [Escherichia coli DEC11B]